MLVALALRCLTLTVDLGRFAIHSRNVSQKHKGRFVVHEGGKKTIPLGSAVIPKIEFSTDPRDFLGPRAPQASFQEGCPRWDRRSILVIRLPRPHLKGADGSAKSKYLAVKSPHDLHHRPVTSDIRLVDNHRVI
ncbi:uncharacterized protein BDV17DRAFT_275635 [Aspergillus undulatus]|uniref:uncharacterized protein n=1 Tax=Aspergillus undulatus TaxID=1810928 RepID=UPI003CCCF14C